MCVSVHACPHVLRPSKPNCGMWTTFKATACVHVCLHVYVYVSLCVCVWGCVGVHILVDLIETET